MYKTIFVKNEIRTLRRFYDKEKNLTITALYDYNTKKCYNPESQKEIIIKPHWIEDDDDKIQRERVSELFAKDIENKLNELEKEGFQIINIIPETKGKKSHFVDEHTGYGWGYGYTAGVIIIAKK